ncbi:EamA-like transporter family protein [methanogenic archaeon mixed culture ISO4-G1]|nr:EamA-like transporter family protein [methanogenic archaeon mixed culture ISO4-G1]
MADLTKQVGTAAGIASGVLWGFLGVFSRELTAYGMSSMQITCMRFLFLALGVLPYILLFERDQLRISRKSLGILIFMGAFGLAFSSAAYMESVNHASLAVASITSNLHPFFVLMFSIPLLHEKLTKIKVISLLIAFTGCVICTGIFSTPETIDYYGVMMGVSVGAIYCFYTIGSKVVSSRDVSIMGAMFYTALFSSLALIPLCDFPDAITTVVTNVPVLEIMLVFSLGMSLGQIILYIYAVGKIGAGKVSILIYSETIAAAIIGLALYGEPITLDVVAGMALAVVGLVILYMDKQNDGIKRDAPVER